MSAYYIPGIFLNAKNRTVRKTGGEKVGSDFIELSFKERNTETNLKINIKYRVCQIIISSMKNN